jgi:hypothetical protein
MIEKADRRDHSPAVRARPMRVHTTAIVLHHLGIDINRDGATTVDEAIDFFVRDPEGVATVCLGGAYSSKVPTIARWKADGLPAVYQGRGFVPYHFLVDADGGVHRMLDLTSIGAHAGAWNDRSVGVACLGDFAARPPTISEVASLVSLLRDILSVYPHAEIVSHDETLERDGQQPKGCPGKFFPLEGVREAVRR